MKMCGLPAKKRIIFNLFTALQPSTSVGLGVHFHGATHKEAVTTMKIGSVLYASKSHCVPK